MQDLHAHAVFRFDPSPAAGGDPRRRRRRKGEPRRRRRPSYRRGRPTYLFTYLFCPPPCPRPRGPPPARSPRPPRPARPAPAPSARERASDRAGDRLCVARPARFYASDPISRGEFTRSDPFLRGPTRFIRGPIRVVDFTRRPDFTRVADPISRGPIRVYASDPILTRPTHGPTRFHASEVWLRHSSLRLPPPQRTPSRPFTVQDAST